MVSNLKSRKFFGKIRTAFEEIDLLRHRFWLSVESLKEFVKKISRQHNYS